jgi:hypothetical protein
VALASLDDINIHLPDDKIEVDSARYELLQLDAERVVRGYLAGYIDPTVLVTWTSPEATPDLIRAIAGRLVAAFYYRERYSEDSLADPEYAKLKYDEAIAWLTAIQLGTMSIGVVVTGGESLTESDFWPNATTPGPIFTMDQQL